MKPLRYIIALLLTVSICLGLYCFSAQRQLEKIQTLSEDNVVLKGQISGLLLLIDNMENENARLNAQVKGLSIQVRLLKDGKLDRPDETNRGGERWTKRTMHCTAYWKGSCGKKPDDPAYGITASGEPVQVGMVAAYWPELPEGTRIFIPYFNRVFVVADRGGAIDQGDIDIYMETENECKNFGVRDLPVYILE